MEIFKDVVPMKIIDDINNFIDRHYKYDRDMFVFPNFKPEFRDFFIQRIPAELRRLLHDDSYVVLRMVKPGTRREFEFHFDAYEETIVVPLKLVDDEFNGDLLIERDTRRTPRNIFVQVLQKFLYQNWLALRHFRKAYERGGRFSRVTLKTGSIFKFNGVRCLHATLPISKGERRTVLIHSKKLFSDSWVTSKIEKYSQSLVLKQ